MSVLVPAALGLRVFRCLVTRPGAHLLLAGLVLVSSMVVAHAEGWTEVKRVTVTPGAIVTIAMDDNFRVVEDRAGVVRRAEGRHLEVKTTGSEAVRVRVERGTRGALEVLLVPVFSASTYKPLENDAASPTAPAASDQASSAVPGTVAVTAGPAAAGEGSTGRVPRVAPGSADAGELPVPAVRPIVNAPAAFLSSVLSPFMPVPPLATLSPALPLPGHSTAGAIVAPPRPLVLSTPPAARLVPSPDDRIPVTGTLAPPPGPSYPVNDDPADRAIDAAPSSPRMDGSVGPAFELPVLRGSMRPVDTSLAAGVATKPGELAIFTLASDLEARGLWGDAIQQYRRLLNEYPSTKLREEALLHIGHCFKERAIAMEAEALRQFDLRRSGAANEAVDQAIQDYSEAITSYRDLLRSYPQAQDRNRVQLRIAQSLHGLVRAQFQKGTAPQDSPAVVVEYLRAFVGTDDTELLSPARLGIAQYYRDLADARMLTRQDRVDVRRAYDRALSEYRALIDSSPSAPAAEEALIDVARLFDRNIEMRNFEGAVKYYEELLRRFPASRFAEEARTRSRWLKDNYL